MSKELELFQQIVKGYTEVFNMAINHPKDTIVKWEGVEEIEKSLKALEIIKDKEWFDDFMKEHLTREWFTKGELDLLKEVLL